MSKRARLIRADDSDDDNNLGVVHGQVTGLSKDGRRIVRTAVSAVARSEGNFLRPGEIPEWAPRFNISHTHGLDASRGKVVRRYRNSDQNMLCWMEENMAQEFLQEFMRLEGRGDSTYKFCLSCFDGLRLMVPGEPLYRCETCWGTRLECLACVLMQHKRHPFHRVLRWNGTFFEKVTLAELGLRVQLGHDDGEPCTNPQSAPTDFTILHTNAIHKVNADFCGCERRQANRIQMLRSEIFPATTRYPKTGVTFRLLEEFEMLSSSGKTSVYEHYQALEKLTDNTRMGLPKGRYKCYFRINRQFAHLKMMKRAGRGSVQDGIATTRAGELAVICPACPQEGVNMPPGWESLPKDKQFLNRIILALDANFRLKNLRRPGTHDPGLHTGLAYFVENAPYLAHIARYPRQKDISSCSGFKTLAHAESKNAAGLQSTGVGMCVCARHEFVRPNGVGDLQKGERYCNMDYVALSAARHIKNLPIFWSYDIACQWCINFLDRMKELPSNLQLTAGTDLGFGVPKCHCKGHKLACQVNFSLNVQPGLAQTDAESPERTWFLLNNIAPSTKEMLPGGRRDMLDRRIGAHNWDKFSKIIGHYNIKACDILDELLKNETAHEQFTLILPLEDVQKWAAEVLAWENNRSLPNPYFQAQSHKSEQSVRQAIAEEERKAARETAPLHETSPSVMLSMGFMTEDLVRRVEQILASDEKDAPACVQEVHDKRVQIGAYIRQLRELQRVYMPGVAAKLKESVGTREGDIEEEKLWLPSEFDEDVREKACTTGLVAIEEKMREAQCYDALDTIRNMETAKRTLIAFRKQNIRGNRRTGRAHAIVNRLEGKSGMAVAKYRAARDALFEFRGEGAWENVLKPLLDADIAALDGVSFDIELPKQKKQKMRPVDPLQQLGSGSRSISWIWLMEGAVGDDADQLNGTVRIEWLKSRARVNRRREEAELLKREKENIMLSFEHEACEWEKRVEPWDGLDDADVEGLRALAGRKADMYRSFARHALDVWSKPPASRTKTVPDRVGVREFEEEEDTDDELDIDELLEAREAAENDEDATLNDD